MARSTKADLPRLANLVAEAVSTMMLHFSLYHNVEAENPVNEKWDARKRRVHPTYRHEIVEELKTCFLELIDPPPDESRLELVGALRAFARTQG
ncbi:MAG UNVERIFIED_CONTAM: hypothetical protein LVR29_04995 [Microcystis novacekii LVE1205-3]